MVVDMEKNLTLSLIKNQPLTIAIRPCQRGLPAANSLQADTLGEFAGTAYSRPLYAIRRMKRWRRGLKVFFKALGIKVFQRLVSKLHELASE